MDPTSITVNAALSAARHVYDASAGWKSFKPRFVQVAEFKRLVDNNAVLDFSPKTNLSEFVSTPILQKLFKCEGRGLVSIVHVPSGRGKTTAAMAFLTAFKKKVRGIAICGRHGSANFVDEMAELLGNPPNGWLPCLVDALNSGDEDTRTTFLILDEYSGIPGTSHGNDELLRAIKSHVRDSRIHVVVLSPNEAYATHALSLNALEGIVPMKDTYDIDSYPNGSWTSMEWSTAMLKSAAKKRPALKNYAHLIDQEVDAYTSANSENSPLRLFEHLETTFLENPLSPVGQSFSVDNEFSCDEACIVS